MVTKLLFPICVAALAAGCSVLIDVDRKQCETNADCDALATTDTPLECRQNLCVATQDDPGGGGAAGAGSDPLVCTVPEVSTAETVKYTFAPVFAPGATPEVPQPFAIKACGTLDLDCEHPVFGPIDVNAGEPQDFEVPPGFAGYFEIKNPDTIDGLLFLGRPVNEDTLGWAITMPTPEVVVGLAKATGEQVDENLGFILSVARDCNGLPLSDVTYENSKGGLGYYFVMNLPDTSLTKTGPQGAAGYANVPISTTILSGVHDSGTKLGPVSVRVKPRTLSFAEIFP